MLTAQAAPPSSRELWWSFIAIFLITLVYLFVAITWSQIPDASGLFGHLIGVLGFILMLLTETLYTWRKRSQNMRWGRISSWLRAHIFPGIVGPYMVLLHTSWKFNGLAGIVLLLTVIIVISGFVGRYVYTSIPRTADGIEVETNALEAQIAVLEAQIGRWQEAGAAAGAASARREERSNRQHTEISTRPNPKELKTLMKRRQALHRQFASLATARRVMALWHTIHIPIGLALFTAAFIHIVAAFYYASLLR